VFGNKKIANKASFFSLNSDWLMSEAEKLLTNTRNRQKKVAEYA